MTSDTDFLDAATFGNIVKGRRRALQMSQEALATEALGNPDRKSFVSAVENNRVSRITPNMAQRFCAALGISREELPPSLRWPLVAGDELIEERLRTLEEIAARSPDHRVVSDAINQKFEEVIGSSPSALYRSQLRHYLSKLQTLTGRPFGLQSMMFCYAASLLYVVAAALLSYAAGDISVGTVRLFDAVSWDNTQFAGLIPLICILFVGACFLICWGALAPFGRRQMSARQKAARLGVAMVISGICCGTSTYFGLDPMAVAVIFALPCFAAVSTFAPMTAMFVGLFGGIVSGPLTPLISSLRETGVPQITPALLNGVIVGCVIGSIAGWVSSKVRLQIATPASGQLAGAAAGIAVGSLLLLGAIIGGGPNAIDARTLGLFAVVWLTLPLVNAVLDAVSLGISQLIASLVIQHKSGTTTIALLGAVDLILAVFLVIFSTTAIALALVGLSVFLGVETGGIAFVQISVDDPLGQGRWLTLMVLTTTFWTWLHFAGLVAPLLSSAFARLIDAAATKQLKFAQAQGEVSIAAGILIGVRHGVYYLLWSVLAVLPIAVLAGNEVLLSDLIATGLQLANLALNL